MVLGRKAEDHEIERGLRLIADIELQSDSPSASDEKRQTSSREQAWQSLCRVLLASNEFIYIE